MHFKTGAHNYFFKKVVLIAQLLNGIHYKVMFLFTDKNILLQWSQSVLLCRNCVHVELLCCRLCVRCVCICTWLHVCVWYDAACLEWGPPWERWRQPCDSVAMAFRLPCSWWYIGELQTENSYLLVFQHPHFCLEQKRGKKRKLLQWDRKPDVFWE